MILHHRASWHLDRPWAVGLVLALVLAGCAGDPGGSAAPTTIASPPVDLTPVPGGTPDPPTIASPSVTDPPSDTVATVACEGTDVAFAVAVLHSPVELIPDTPPGRGLRAFVETDAGAEIGLPREGWRLASFRAPRATFVAPTGDGWAFATLVEQADQSWAFDEGGACEVVAKAPPALGFASWTLDAAAPPAPGARSIQILAREEACANGEPAAERALPPIIEEAETSVSVTLLVRRLENADCQANPTYPVVIELAAPLGERRLFDGSAYPPISRD